MYKFQTRESVSVSLIYVYVRVKCHGKDATHRLYMIRTNHCINIVNLGVLWISRFETVRFLLFFCVLRSRSLCLLSRLKRSLWGNINLGFLITN